MCSARKSVAESSPNSGRSRKHTPKSILVCWSLRESNPPFPAALSLSGLHRESSRSASKSPSLIANRIGIGFPLSGQTCPLSFSPASLGSPFPFFCSVFPGLFESLRSPPLFRPFGRRSSNRFALKTCWSKSGPFVERSQSTPISGGSLESSSSPQAPVGTSASSSRTSCSVH